MQTAIRKNAFYRTLGMSLWNQGGGSPKKFGNHCPRWCGKHDDGHCQETWWWAYLNASSLWWHTGLRRFPQQCCVLLMMTACTNAINSSPFTLTQNSQHDHPNKWLELEFIEWREDGCFCSMITVSFWGWKWWHHVSLPTTIKNTSSSAW
jgi:hypothetical protein